MTLTEPLEVHQVTMPGMQTADWFKEYLIVVIRTQEQVYEPAQYHLAVFLNQDVADRKQPYIKDLVSNGKCLAFQLIPGLQQVWNDPKNTEKSIGEVVRVQYDASDKTGGSFKILTVVNYQEPSGGVALLVWHFDRITESLQLVEQRQLDKLHASKCHHFNFIESSSAATPISQQSQVPYGVKPFQLRFVTTHTAARYQGQWTLNFWSYTPAVADLFLENQVHFALDQSGGLTKFVYSCPLSKLFFLERPREATISSDLSSRSS